jgi:hypothetical protein
MILVSFARALASASIRLALMSTLLATTSILFTSRLLW